MRARPVPLCCVLLALAGSAPPACVHADQPGTEEPPSPGEVREDAAATPAPDVAPAEPEPERHWVVWADDIRLLEISNRPGAIIDTTAPPPPPVPGAPPPQPHPFLGAACGGDPLLCSRAGVILRASTSLEEFLAALAAEGWRVEETTP
jgi:hypothetical protein